MSTRSDDNDLLVDAAWLSERLGEGSLMALDCWRAAAYERAHIPGAVHIGHDYWLKQPDVDGDPRGCLLLPAEELRDLFGGLGVSENRHVVMYDDNGGRAATRVWWVLRYLGHPRVSVLDGGWHAWIDGGGAASYGEPDVQRVEFAGTPQPRRLATLADVQEAASSGCAQLIDARAPDEWRGTDPHGNRRGGHIPTAQHLEWSELISAGPPWRFRPPGEVRRRLDDAGIDSGSPIITYCQGGVRAAHVAFALERAGCPEVRVYDGSMKEWANRDDTELVME